MGKYVNTQVFSWRGEDYFRGLGYYPYMTLLTRETATALQKEIAHSELTANFREWMNFCEELSEQLEHDQEPFIFMPNEEAVRVLLPVLESSENNELFLICGKWLDQLRWLDRERKRKQQQQQNS